MDLSGKIIGVDRDDVCNNFHNVFLPILSKKSGKKIYDEKLKKHRYFGFDDMKIFDYERFGLDEDDVRPIMDDFQRGLKLSKLSCQNGVFNATKELVNNGAKLYIISNSPEYMRNYTEKWCDKYLPGVFSDIFLTNKFCLEGPKTTKYQICKKLNADILIEDSFSNAFNCLTALRTSNAIVLDKPWNSNSEHSQIYHALSWDNDHSIISGIEKIFTNYNPK